MTEMTSGQAACIAWNEHYAEEHGIEARNEWAASDPRGRAAWDAAAKAAQAPLRDGIAALISDLEASAKATAPSRESVTVWAVVERLQALPGIGGDPQDTTEGDG